MIVRVSMLDNNNKQFVMLFGDSYKKWDMQVWEYFNYAIQWYDDDIILQCNVLKIVNVEKCNAAWKSWGGLKWCEESSFQNELNREGAQDNEPDNPTPRQYKDMHFVYSGHVARKVKKTYKQRMRHLYGCSAEVINEACSIWKDEKEQKYNVNKIVQQ